MANFIATSYYSGSLNIANMRHFLDEGDAHKYVADISGPWDQSRVYEIYPDKPPRLCKKPNKR